MNRENGLSDEQRGPRIGRQIVLTAKPRRGFRLDGVDRHAEMIVVVHGVNHRQRVGSAFGMHRAQHPVAVCRQSGATLVRAELHIANRRPEAAGATGGKA